MEAAALQKLQGTRRVDGIEEILHFNSPIAKWNLDARAQARSIEVILWTQPLAITALDVIEQDTIDTLARNAFEIELIDPRLAARKPARIDGEKFGHGLIFVEEDDFKPSRLHLNAHLVRHHEGYAAARLTD